MTLHALFVDACAWTSGGGSGGVRVYLKAGFGEMGPRSAGNWGGYRVPRRVSARLGLVGLFRIV